eukprot:scaffold1875_cov253-Pinguiococcus_pyrenoidosus.AAC.5
MVTFPSFLRKIALSSIKSLDLSKSPGSQKKAGPCQPFRPPRTPLGRSCCRGKSATSRVRQPRIELLVAATPAPRVVAEA